MIPRAPKLFSSFRSAGVALTIWACSVAGATYDKQSIIDPTGKQAAHVESLWWLYIWILAGIYVLVLAFLAAAVLRRRKRYELGYAVPPELPTKPERGLATAVIIAVAVSLILLVVFFASDLVTGQRINQLSRAENPVKIKLKAQQWWWEIKYDDDLLSNTVTTANEMHLPTGRPVRISMDSPDVIHSFWVPNLSGKRDIIPGHPTDIFIQADEPATLVGQCAEFCGYQHANMRFTVTAEPEAKFEKWLAQRRQSAAKPQTASQKRGQQVFLATSCVMCHAISGTPARATIGPDLSHIASRPTLAAGTLPNTRGHLGAWILDPQRIKPGTKMRTTSISPADLQALLDYLESLK